MKTYESRLTMLILTVGMILFSNSCTLSHVSSSAKNWSGVLPKDAASCHKKADALIDRELKLDPSYDRTGKDSLEVSFARFDAQKQRSRYFDNCMSERKNRKLRNINN